MGLVWGQGPPGLQATSGLASLSMGHYCPRQAAAPAALSQ